MPARILPSILFSLAIVVSSCAPQPVSPSPTSPPTQPIPTETVVPSTESTVTGKEFALLRAGFSYSDAPNDMVVSFLNLVGFQATVNEESELLEVVFHLRDIPHTATHRQTRYVAEYNWHVSVFLDPSKINTSDPQPDYSLSLMTLETDPPVLVDLELQKIDGIWQIQP